MREMITFLFTEIIFNTTKFVATIVKHGENWQSGNPGVQI